MTISPAWLIALAFGPDAILLIVALAVFARVARSMLDHFGEAHGELVRMANEENRRMIIRGLEDHERRSTASHEVWANRMLATGESFDTVWRELRLGLKHVHERHDALGNEQTRLRVDVEKLQAEVTTLQQSPLARIPGRD